MLSCVQSNKKRVINMNDKEIIRAAMKARNISQQELANRAAGSDSAPQTGVSEALRRKNGMRIDKFARFLEVMKYEVIVRDPETKQEWKLVMGE